MRGSYATEVWAPTPHSGAMKPKLGLPKGPDVDTLPPRKGMRMKRIFVLCVSMCLATPAESRRLPDSVYRMRTGNDLYSLCTSSDPSDVGRCLGWIMGLT